MTKRTSESWRNRITSATTEILPTDTVLPLDNYNNQTPLVFRIRQIPSFGIDTKNIQLQFDFKVQKLANDQWVNIERADKIAPENGFGFTLWSDVHLAIAGSLVESTQEYGRISYLKNLLFKTVREQHALESAMFFLDNPLWGDTIHQNKDVNAGEFLRGESIKDGKIKSVTTPIYLDLFQTSGYFPDTVSFELRLFMAKPEICIFQDADSPTAGDFAKTRVVITAANLKVPRFQMSSGMHKTMTTNYESCRVLSFTNPQGMASFSKNFNTHQVPQKIAVAVMTEERWNGKPNKSPLYFHHCDVSNISVKVNDHVYPNQNGMNVDAANNYFNEPYNALFEGFGAIAPHFSLSTVDNGFAIFPVMLTPSQQRDDRVLHGATDINVLFKKAAPTNQVILIFCYINGKFSFDKHGCFQSSLNPKLQ